SWFSKSSPRRDDTSPRGAAPLPRARKKLGPRTVDLVCGIAGIFDLKGAAVARAPLAKMTQAIAHRGPDGEGHYLDGPIGLGHRRLAIPDLRAAGNPPLA